MTREGAMLQKVLTFNSLKWRREERMGEMSRGGGWGLQRMTAFVLTIGLEAGLRNDGQVN